MKLIVNTSLKIVNKIQTKFKWYKRVNAMINKALILLWFNNLIICKSLEESIIKY